MECHVRSVDGDTATVVLHEGDTLLDVKAKVVAALGYAQAMQHRVALSHLGEPVELEVDEPFAATGVVEWDEIGVELLDDPSYVNPSKHLKKAVGLVAPYHYCVKGAATSLPPPLLTVSGQILASPLSSAQAAGLSALPTCEDRGSGCLRFPSSSLTFENPEWGPAFDGFAAKQCARIGVPGAAVQLRELLVFKAGSGMKLCASGDNVFGMLVLVMPSVHGGGDVAVLHGVEEARLVSGGHKSLLAPQYAAFYTGCEAAAETLASGHSVMLVYHLVKGGVTQPVPQHAAVHTLHELEKLWVVKSDRTRESYERYALNGSYGDLPVWEDLEGQDLAVIHALKVSGVFDYCLLAKGRDSDPQLAEGIEPAPLFMERLKRLREYGYEYEEFYDNRSEISTLSGHSNYGLRFAGNAIFIWPKRLRMEFLDVEGTHANLEALLNDPSSVTPVSLLGYPDISSYLLAYANMVFPTWWVVLKVALHPAVPHETQLALLRKATPQVPEVPLVDYVRGLADRGLDFRQELLDFITRCKSADDVRIAARAVSSLCGSYRPLSNQCLLREAACYLLNALNLKVVDPTIMCEQASIDSRRGDREPERSAAHEIVVRTLDVVHALNMNRQAVFDKVCANTVLFSDLVMKDVAGCVRNAEEAKVVSKRMLATAESFEALSKDWRKASMTRTHLEKLVVVLLKGECGAYLDAVAAKPYWDLDAFLRCLNGALQTVQFSGDAELGIWVAFVMQKLRECPCVQGETMARAILVLDRLAAGFSTAAVQATTVSFTEYSVLGFLNVLKDTASEKGEACRWLLVRAISSMPPPGYLRVVHVTPYEHCAQPSSSCNCADLEAFLRGTSPSQKMFIGGDRDGACLQKALDAVPPAYPFQIQVKRLDAGAVRLTKQPSMSKKNANKLRRRLTEMLNPAPPAPPRSVPKPVVPQLVYSNWGFAGRSRGRGRGRGAVSGRSRGRGR
eukprot:TRINITY_DN1485_c0_g1_i5.p1 TRINITY_DN1485_c0_g1~~TRINITY_DN1485_c0_g1_i5.p1  ORF type:complete len:961 (+),score=140.43 TRINITY_DN1485_c0_g1_i5:47-2929(+)